MVNKRVENHLLQIGEALGMVESDINLDSITIRCKETMEMIKSHGNEFFTFSTKDPAKKTCIRKSEVFQVEATVGTLTFHMKNNATTTITGVDKNEFENLHEMVNGWKK